MSLSIKDVALRAGCSIATVSRVLAGKGYISDEARAKVEQAVKDLGYRPNQVARSLRARKSRVIGLVLSDIRNPFFSEISRAVEAVAFRHGYTVLMCNTDEDPKREVQFLKLMEEEKVAGILLSPTRSHAKSLDPGSLPPMALFDRKVVGANLDTVVIDNEEASSKLTRTLLSGPYQKIAGIFGAKSFTASARINGFKSAFKGCEERLQGIYQAPAFEEEGARLMAEILDGDAAVDAVLCSSALLATGAYRTLRERGLRLTEQFGFVCFDDPAWASFVDPPITVIRQPAAAVGEAAAELLMKRIADPSRPVSEIVLQGELILRGNN